MSADARPPHRRSLLLVVAAVLVLLALPSVLTRDLVTALFFTFTFITLALNYDLLGGFLGYLNLGQGTFFGLGAYGTFILSKEFPDFAEKLGAPALTGMVVASMALVVIFAFVMAFPLFRLRGAYFAMATFGLFLLIRQLLLNLEKLTGGASGIYLPPGFFLGQRGAYSLMLGLMLASLAINFFISRTRLGVAFRAIRESEHAAAAIGVDPFKHKQLALVISAVPSALAGALFGLHFGYVDLESVVGTDKTLFPVIMAMFGGSGMVWGPVVGGALIRVLDVGLKNYAILPVPALGIYGLILMIIGLFRPEGILAGVGRRRPAG